MNHQKPHQIEDIDNYYTRTNIVFELAGRSCLPEACCCRVLSPWVGSQLLRLLYLRQGHPGKMLQYYTRGHNNEKGSLQKPHPGFFNHAKRQWKGNHSFTPKRQQGCKFGKYWVRTKEAKAKAKLDDLYTTRRNHAVSILTAVGKIHLTNLRHKTSSKWTYAQHEYCH